MFQLVPAINTDMATIASFFGSHWEKQLYKKDLYNFGQFIEINGEKLGFFAIIPCDDDEGWLRSLYLKESFSPSMIMLGIDWITRAAEHARFQKIYAFSHSSSTDILFETWGFQKLTEQPAKIVDTIEQKGNWWMLSTSVDNSCGKPV